MISTSLTRCIDSLSQGVCNGLVSHRQSPSRACAKLLMLKWWRISCDSIGVSRESTVECVVTCKEACNHRAISDVPHHLQIRSLSVPCSRILGKTSW